MKLFYETHGTGAPLILIPGFASGAWTWAWQAELANDFRVITFDPRGIGKSPNDVQNPSMATFIADVLAVLDDLKIEKANVLGASFGGFVAMEFAKKFPERLDKLVLACTSAGGANHVRPDIEILRSFTPDANLSIGESIRKFIRPAFNNDFNAEVIEKVCRMREENEVSETVYSAQLQVAFSFDFESELNKIEAETLVITGNQDRVVPMPNSLNLAEKLPNATLKVIEGGSHLFFVENADEFNQAIKEFLLKNSGQ